MDVIKDILSILGAIGVVVAALVLGGSFRDNRERAGRVRDDIDRAADDNRRAAELAEESAADVDKAIGDNKRATGLAKRAADDNKRALDIIRRVRERAKPPKDTDSDF